MFTGIIETLGEIKEIDHSGSGRIFYISSPISNELRTDQSLSHDGVCLTVEAVQDGIHRVTAIEETLKKTNLANWKIRALVNLERCLPINGRLDGHIVQGHVDSTALCTERRESGGSWEYKFEFPKKFSPLVIEKGSISLNGISLTLFDVKKKSFRVAIIPYTFEHTNMKSIQPGMNVNIEFDMIGKYIVRSMQLKNS
jgi:riboflavin synthase